MILSYDSVLVSLPLLLNIEQRRFLTGVRFAAESAQHFHSELHADLKLWDELPLSMSRREEHLRLFAAAWAMVDNGRRFHRLLWKIPFLNKIEFVEKFVEYWKTPLRSARDAMQHPDLDYPKDMEDNYVYGSIQWIDSRLLHQGRTIAHAVNAGPQANSELSKPPFQGPISTDINDSVHSLKLSTAGASIQLDDLMCDIKNTLLLLEEHVGQSWREVREAVPENNTEREVRLALRAQTDTFFRLELKPHMNEVSIIQ